jgi:hypothetical protein
MGSARGRGLGIFDDKEVEHLSDDDHRKLEQHVLEHLQQQTSDLLKTKPDSKIREVKDIVKEKSKPFLDSLPKS